MRMPRGAAKTLTTARPRIRTALRIGTALLLASVLGASLPAAAAGKRTVCTITVNSTNERDAFARHLNPDQHEFVELVDHRRSDWLGKACAGGVHCDVLIISGHHDGEDFFSDRLDLQQHLPVAELEHASCSESCPGLFADLKEVYLFGCNTLNPQPLNGAAAEVVRALARESRTNRQSQQLLQSMSAGHGESSRDLMRQVFQHTPAIYGFSSAAPLGPIAANSLELYLRNGGAREVGSGRPSQALLQQFNAFNMATASGVDVEQRARPARRDICQFADQRLSLADRLRFVHQLLRGPSAEAGMHLDRIRRLTKTLDTSTRRIPEVADALQAIHGDHDARERFLDFARRSDAATVRVRMLDVAQDLGWLSSENKRTELAMMMDELLANKRIGVEEVNIACTVNQSRELDRLFADSSIAGDTQPGDVAQFAVRACLGDWRARARTLDALISPREHDVELAQAYLRYRTITDVEELRRISIGIATMNTSDAQVRALESLAAHITPDRTVLATLVRLYTETPSAAIQAAIAGILIRVDRQVIASPQLIRILEDHRRPSPAGDNLIDALIRSLQSP